MNFEQMNSLISQVINNKRKLLIIDNNIPGMGVVTNLLEQFKQSTLVRNKGYGYCAGFLPLASFFINLLETESHNDVIILDDCDELLENTDCVNILKSLIDTGECSLITKTVNKTVEFKGSFIILTRYKNKNTESLISRGIDITVQAD